MSESQQKRICVQSECYYRTILESDNKRLREALEKIVKRDRHKMYETCPDCEDPDYCDMGETCKCTELSQVGEIAQQALEGNK